MKKLLIALFIFLFLITNAFSQLTTSSQIDDNSTTDNSITDDNSVHYYIELGDGNSIIIFGDGNTIYLPANDPVKIVPNQVTFAGEDVRIVMQQTEIIVDGIATTFSKVVLVLNSNGWSVVWYEQ